MPMAMWWLSAALSMAGLMGLCVLLAPGRNTAGAASRTYALPSSTAAESGDEERAESQVRKAGG